MNTYYTSTGQALSQSQLDRYIRNAKKLKIERQRTEYGYNFCQVCKTNQGYLDCSHDIPVKWCKDNRQSELCYELINITVRCRDCHNKHDKT